MFQMCDYCVYSFCSSFFVSFTTSINLCPKTLQQKIQCPKRYDNHTYTHWSNKQPRKRPHTHTHTHAHTHTHTRSYTYIHKFDCIGQGGHNCCRESRAGRGRRKSCYSRAFVERIACVVPAAQASIYESEKQIWARLASSEASRLFHTKYSQSHLGWHFQKLKARTSLLPRFSEKRRSSFELWALK